VPSSPRLSASRPTSPTGYTSGTAGTPTGAVPLSRTPQPASQPSTGRTRDRDVNYSVLDLEAQTALAESIGSGGRISPELAAIRQAQLAQTAVENFSSTLAPGGSSVMTYTVAEQPTGNTGVEFAVTMTWADVSGNHWSRTNTAPPELLTQGAWS